MSEEFMEKIEWARANCDFPWIVRSGYRCLLYDKEIGGEGNHPMGEAIDVAFSNSHQLFIIIRESIQQGIRRIGISFKDKFVHLDIVKGRPDEIIWGY